MKTKIVAYGNNDDALLLWTVDAVDAAFRSTVFEAVMEATEAFVEVVPTGLLGDPMAPGTTLNGSQASI